jgi:hypothetical protein
MKQNVKFDPQTGRPINEGGMYFDPRTGRPIDESNMRFDPQTGRYVAGSPVRKYVKDPGRKRRRTFNKKRIGVTLAAAAGGTVLLSALWMTGVLAGPKGRLARSIERTFTQDDLFEAVETLNTMTRDGEFSITASGGFSSDYMGEVTLNQEGSEESIEFSLDDEYSYYSGSVYMDEEEVILNPSGIEPLSEWGLLSYNYQEEKDGSNLASSLGSSEILELIDEALKIYHTSMSGAVDQKAVQKAVQKVLAEQVDVEKTASKDIKVGGKRVPCQGYRVEINGDLYSDILDAVYETAYGKSMSDLYDMEYTLKNTLNEEDEILSGIEDFSRNIGEISVIADLEFYLHSGKIVQIIATSDYPQDEGAKITISFEGGNVPWHDTKIEYYYDGAVQEITHLKTDKEGSETHYTFIAESDRTDLGPRSENKTLAFLSYDRDSGAYELEVEGDRLAGGILKVYDKSVDFSIDELAGEDFTLQVQLDDDASVESPSGSTTDISSLSMYDLF